MLLPAPAGAFPGSSSYIVPLQVPVAAGGGGGAHGGAVQFEAVGAVGETCADLLNRAGGHVERRVLAPLRRPPSEQADEAELAEDPLAVMQLRVRIPLLPHHRDPRAEAPHGERPVVDFDSQAPRSVVARPAAQHPGGPVALVVQPMHGARTPYREASQQRRRGTDLHPPPRMAPLLALRP